MFPFERTTDPLPVAATEGAVPVFWVDVVSLFVEAALVVAVSDWDFSAASTDSPVVSDWGLLSSTFSLLALFSLLELISVDLTKSAVDSDVVDAVEGAGVTESENALTNPLLIRVESDTAKMTIKLVTIATGTANDFFAANLIRRPL